mmetsp:Transcript_67409/g.112896  ORF Transcript_67409/g.112896 Transcript_67409/m.112896 type:complete len:90 (+) Transcript_67409:890-1159(+)
MPQPASPTTSTASCNVHSLHTPPISTDCSSLSPEPPLWTMYSNCAMSLSGAGHWAILLPITANFFEVVERLSQCKTFILALCQNDFMSI